MRILLVHNYYRSGAPSGENMVLEVERDLLRNRGHEVREFVRHSDNLSHGILGEIRGGLATPWNPIAAREIRNLVLDFKPDIVHAHNTFPLISPAIFPALRGLTARVLTLHNYRLFCGAAIPMRRNGEICMKCLENRSPLSAILDRCYRGSVTATFPIAVNVALHRLAGTWRKEVEAFIALTEFQREVMVRSGLPESRVEVKPNFYPGSPNVSDWNARQNRVVFAGRLSPEKGVADLIRAWRAWGSCAPELRVVGDGPLRNELESIAQGSNVRFLGQMQPSDAQREIASSRLLVLPSTWFECFPMTIREAFAFGTPVATSDVGPLPSIVRQDVSGLIFRAGDSQSILSNIRAAWENPAKLRQLAVGARMEYESKYTEDVNYARLMSIYARAMESRPTDAT